MPDPNYTLNYSLTLPVSGGDSGSWGNFLNNGVMTLLDNILGQTFSTLITSSDVTLTTSQFDNSLFVVGGQLTGNRNLIIPFTQNIATVCCAGKFLVYNNGSGSFNLTVKTATTGLGVTVPQGFVVNLYSDGTNVGYANNGLPGYAAASNGNPNGQLAGTAGSVNTNASIAVDYSGGNLYFCTTSGTASSAVWSNVTGNPGFDTAKNLSFTTSITGNALTVTAVAANTGTSPVNGNPIVIPFRDPVLGNGDPIIVNATSALSITIYSSASLGAINGTPFRFWIIGFNNSGTPVLGLINCLNGNGIFALNEGFQASSFGMSSGATSAGTPYSPAGVPVTSKAFRILGYLEYSAGLVTAGTYNILPTTVQLFGPGIKKPGDIVQTVSTTVTALNSVTSTTKTLTSTQQNISPTSAANLLRVKVDGSLNNIGGGAPTSCGAQMGRNSNGTLFGSVASIQDVTNVGHGGPASLLGYDLPGTTVSTNYAVYVWSNNGQQVVWNPTITNGVAASVMAIDEIMA